VRVWCLTHLKTLVQHSRAVIYTDCLTSCVFGVYCLADKKQCLWLSVQMTLTLSALAMRGKLSFVDMTYKSSLTMTCIFILNYIISATYSLPLRGLIHLWVKIYLMRTGAGRRFKSSLSVNIAFA